LEEPELYDHSYLDLLNRHTMSFGLDPIFEFVVVPPREGNGEIFLSKYFEEQQNRNLTVGQAGQDNKTMQLPPLSSVLTVQTNRTVIA
jgi:hypothetical protein